LVGVLAGSFIPAQIQGLDFALTALFITLTVDSIRSLKDIPSVVLASGSFLIAMLVWPQQRLLLALLLFVASLVVRHVIRERGEES
jgi:branched chain amino acid exporter, large subunit